MIRLLAAAFSILFILNGYSLFLSKIFPYFVPVINIVILLLTVFITLLRSPLHAFILVYIPVRAILPKILLFNIGGLPDFNMHQNVMIIIFLSHIIFTLYKANFQKWKPRMIDFVFIGFYACYAISVTLNDGLWEMQSRLRVRVLDELLVYFLARAAIEGPKMRQLFLKTLVYTHLVLIPFFLLDFRFGYEFINSFFNAPILDAELRWGFVRVKGVYGHPIITGIIYGQIYVIYNWFRMNYDFDEFTPKLKVFYAFCLPILGFLLIWVPTRIAISKFFATLFTIFNAMAFFILLFIFLFNIHGSMDKNRRFRFLSFIFTKEFFAPINLLLLLGLFSTISRGPWVSTIFFMYIAWVGLMRGKVKKAAVIFLFIICGYIPFKMYEIKARTEGTAGTYRHLMRTVWYRDILLYETGWFGVGILDAKYVQNRYGIGLSRRSIDDAALHLEFHHGRIIVYFYNLFFIVGWYYCLFILFKTPSQSIERSLAFLFAGSIAFMFNALHNVWLSPEAAYFLFLILGWQSGLVGELKNPNYVFEDRRYVTK